MFDIRPKIDQLPHNSGVVISGRHMEGSPAPLVRSVDRGAGIEQVPQHLDVPPLRGRMKRGLPVPIGVRAWTDPASSESPPTHADGRVIVRRPC